MRIKQWTTFLLVQKLIKILELFGTFRSYQAWSKDVESPSVVLMEGIFVLYSHKIRESLNMKVHRCWIRMLMRRPCCFEISDSLSFL